MRRIFLGLLIALNVLCLCGCTLMSQERVKLRDLDFTVFSEEKIPQELAEILEEKKSEAFQLTYKDGEALYICIGYGPQETGGYSMSVKALYLQDGTICLETSSSGPEKDEEAIPAPSCPYLVVKLPYREEPVVFL